MRESRPRFRVKAFLAAICLCRVGATTAQQSEQAKLDECLSLRERRHSDAA